MRRRCDTVLEENDPPASLRGRALSGRLRLSSLCVSRFAFLRPLGIVPIRHFTIQQNKSGKMTDDGDDDDDESNEIQQIQVEG